MSVFSSLRGSIHCRYLVLWRADPAAVAPLLPEPMLPATYRGRALIGVCYTRMVEEQGGWLPLSMGTDHLAWRIPVEIPQVDESPRHAVWVPRRNTSSWFGARCAGKLTPGNWSLSRFTFDEGPSSVELRVESDDVDFVLRARRTDELRGSLFLEPHEVCGFLMDNGTAHPPFALAPGFDHMRIDAAEWNVEPLEVDELRARRYEDPDLFPDGSIEFDCALRMSTSAVARIPLASEVMRPAEGATGLSAF